MMPADGRKLVAACGNYCGRCDDYIAHITKNKKLQEKVAGAIMEQLNIDITPEQVGCLGCWGQIHNAWSASLECKIRQCVENKNIANCALCGEFPCKTYNRQFANDSQPRKNINRIREIGVDSWLKEMEVEN